MKSKSMRNMGIGVLLCASLIAPGQSAFAGNVSASQSAKVSTTMSKSTPKTTTGITESITPHYANLSSGKTNALNGEISVIRNGFSNKSGNFYLQEKVKGKWKNIAKTSRKNIANNRLEIRYTIPTRAGGTSSEFRLHHPETTNVEEWTSSTYKATYVYAKSSFSKYTWSDFDKTWATNAPVKLDYVYVSNGGGRTAYLQKYNSKNKKWSSVSSGKVGKNNLVKLKLPGNKTQSTEKFRVYVPKSSKIASTVSSTKTVKFIEPKKYTGYKKKAFDYQKKYCPSVIVNLAKPNKSWLGYAYLGKPEMTVVTGMSNGLLKFVALHECAHILQGKVYDNDLKPLYKVSNKYFGNSKKAAGYERMADCMAVAMGGSKKYMGYVKSCSPTQMKVAKNVLYGKKLVK